MRRDVITGVFHSKIFRISLDITLLPFLLLLL
jgi:hypothetical protein